MKLNSYLKSKRWIFMIFQLRVSFRTFFESFRSFHFDSPFISILSLRWWFTVQDEEVLWIYLDFNGGSNENPWENLRFFFFSLSLSLWSHWFVRWMIQCWNCRGFWLDDEDSSNLWELRTKNSNSNWFCYVIVGLSLVWWNWWESVVIWRGFVFWKFS
jgi:hypothetical protein